MKIFSVVTLFTIIIFFSSATIKNISSHNFPPTNCAGAPNTFTCGWCHNSYADNQPGGGVSIAGIPANYTPGTVYPISLKIHHFASDRKMFGYDIAALDAQGNYVGTFSTTNPTATVNSNELTSHNPALVADTSTKTIAGLFWKAPTTTLTAAQLPITLYFCGNACNYNSKPTGDYIYNDSFHTNPAPLALNFVSFKVDRMNNKTATLQWQCTGENEVLKYNAELSENGVTYQSIAELNAQQSNNKNNTYTYQFNELNMFKSYFFRIKFINKNGLFGYSEVQTLKSNINLATASIFPNPVRKNTAANLHFQTSNNSNCSIVITNTLGVVFEQKIIQVQKGDNNLYYPINPALKSGIYTISIIQDNKVIQHLEIVVND